MNISLELMLQLTIILPAIGALLIVLTNSKPNLRDAVTLTTATILLFIVINLYSGLASNKQITAFWWELLPGLTISFSVEPLGMLFALVASFLWLVTTCYAIGYMRAHKERNQTRFLLLLCYCDQLCDGHRLF